MTIQSLTVQLKQAAQERLRRWNGQSYSADSWIVRLLAEYPDITDVSLEELRAKKDFNSGDPLGRPQARLSGIIRDHDNTDDETHYHCWIQCEEPVMDITFRWTQPTGEEPKHPAHYEKMVSAYNAAIESVVDNSGMREALKPYCQHRTYCESEIRGGKCTCGLDVALAGAEGD